ncbi:MAG: C25 family cysteine peptidase, partial [Salinivirgaceae bacterium]|nr:C25 family cysteine peptidase [Salinivirgaceae bacterium]
AAEQNYNCMKKHVLKVTGMGIHDIEVRWIPTHIVTPTITLTVKNGAIESIFEEEQTALYIKALLNGIKIGEIDLDEMDIAQVLLDHIEFKGIAEDHCDRVGDSAGFVARVRKQPHLLLLYNGHGSAYTNFPYIAKKSASWYNWCDENKVDNDTIFPIFFAQACSNGAYAQISRKDTNRWNSKSFGQNVVTNCCSAFIGASTTTGARWGQLFVKWAFKGKSWSTKEKNESAWEKKEHIGDFLDYAKEKAFDAKSFTVFKLSNPYSACKRFNLFGDPTLFMRGFNIYNVKFQNESFTNNNKMYYKALKTIDTNNKTVVVNKDAELKLIAGEKIMLKQGFKVEKGATFKAEIQKGLPLNN